MHSALALIVALMCLLSASRTLADEQTHTDTATQDNINQADDKETKEEEDKKSSVPEENDVLVLSEKNFDDVIYNNEHILVEFYAPWCGHCKQLAPEYEKAAKALKKVTPPVPLAKVDATIEKSLGERFEVTGYPTLKWFKNGTPYDYDGPRDEKGIVDYAREKSDPHWKPPPQEVLVLTKDNFTEVINREELVILMLYAPWCGHCKRMAPEYEKVAQDLKKDGKKVVLAKVDAIAETDLAIQHHVSGYPTMKIYRRGKMFDYKNEARDKWGMMSYIEKQIGPASRALTGLDEVKKLSTNPERPVHVVSFHNSAEDALFHIYQDAADSLRDDYEFVHTFDPLAQKHFSVEPGSLLVIIADQFHTKHEPKWHTLKLTENSKTQDVEDFVTNHNVPLVAEYSHSTKDKEYKTRRPLCLFFYTVDWSFEHRDATQRWRVKFADIARQFPDMTFAVADEESNAELFTGFSFDESGEEINVGILGQGDKRYPMPPMEEFDPEDVISFIKKFKKGGMKPKIKSQPVPKKQKGPVVTVVGSTFDKIVLDDSKDVFIELYAPWCSHCKALEPVYTQLAKKFKNEKNLVIAKMDATANDLPEGYEVEGYPTIYFAKPGRKSAPAKFHGDKTLEELEKFVRERAVLSFGKGKKKKDKKDEL